ncbi:MAG: hypothetical protein AB9861_18945 [Methanosarcina sp.]
MTNKFLHISQFFDAGILNKLHNLFLNFLVSQIFPVLSGIIYSGVRFEEFIVSRVLLRIGLVKDLKLINGGWGRVEQPPIKYNKKVILLAELLSTIENLAGKI